MKRGLVVVDLQNEYLPTGKLPLSGIEGAVENASRVISHARSSGIPVFHIRHEADNSDVGIFIKGSDGAQIQPAVAPDGNEPVIVKKHINAFRETDLKQQLDAFDVDDIVVVGAMSHMCIDGITRCLEKAEECGVVLALENHWGLARTAAGLLRILDAIINKDS